MKTIIFYAAFYFGVFFVLVFLMAIFLLRVDEIDPSVTHMESPLQMKPGNHCSNSTFVVVSISPST